MFPIDTIVKDTIGRDPRYKKSRNMAPQDIAREAAERTAIMIFAKLQADGRIISNYGTIEWKLEKFERLKKEYGVE